MNLTVARTILIQDRNDQSGPRLRWLPAFLYQPVYRIVSG